MSVSDPVSDMLTRIRNAARAGLPTVDMPHSKMKADIARILKAEGYIAAAADGEDGGRKVLRLTLRYSRGQTPVIRGLRRVSKPGLRRYVPADEIPRPVGGMGVAILSTSRGLMTDSEARRTNVGGEVLCYVW